MAARWAEVLSAYQQLQAIAEGFRELDDERVLVLLRNRGRGKASGLEVEEMHPRSLNVFHLRDGKVVRLAIWWHRDRGLADLELTREIGHQG